MARDRQRAKQRRRRQSGSPARARNQRARDIGLDDASVEESGLGGATPTPNPLDHASAGVDEALIAEAGPPDYADELEDDGRSPDVAEEAEADDGQSPDVAEEIELDDGRAPDVAEEAEADDGRSPDVAEEIELDDGQAPDVAAEAEADDGRAPDVAEDRPEAVAAGVRGEAAAPRRTGPLGRVIGFLAACWAELQRVQWPDRRQVGQGTAVVLGFVILAGAYLGLLDAILSPLIRKIL